MATARRAEPGLRVGATSNRMECEMSAAAPWAFASTVARGPELLQFFYAWVTIRVPLVWRLGIKAVMLVSYRGDLTTIGGISEPLLVS